MKQWLKNAIFYEIYPQSFLDTNGDGIGDFAGIISKLDYIKELGFTAIWMNPCFDSPFGDAGYDVRDYYKAAERYGTNEDLRRLFDEAHRRDMRVILDLVPGHTSVECAWFQESMKAEPNEYSHRYIWTNSIWQDIGNVSGITGVLRGISDRDGCCGVNYYSCQPALNYGFAEITASWQHAVDSEAALATRAEILNVIRFWLDLGCDGFRVDMAFALVKNDKDQEQTILLWKDLLGTVKEEYPNAVFISEWGDPERALRGGYDMDFLLSFGPSHYNDLYHCATPYFSPDGVGSAAEFFAYYTETLSKTKAGGGLICLPSGNHDIPRLSYYCDPTQIKLVYAFIMSMPGVPFIYNGDEIGMRYLPNIRSVEGGYIRTGARTPMQWDCSKNFGFSSADPSMLYIQQDPQSGAPTVAEQLADDGSILSELKRLIAVRRSQEALQACGEFTLLSSEYPLVYLRTLGHQTVLVAINPTNTVRSVPVEDLEITDTLYSFQGTATISQSQLRVPPLSASFLRVRKA